MNSNREFLIPKKGLSIPNPETGRDLPPEGALVTVTGKDAGYWRRRKRDEDVTIGKAPAEKTADKPKN